MAARSVVFLAFEGAQLLDVTGPAEVFSVADAYGGGGCYEVVVASPDGADVTCRSGLRLGVHRPLAEVTGPIDTFIVPGTDRWRACLDDPALADAIRDGAGRSRRVASVCAGALLLGGVGLLEGRRATTHWLFLDEMADLHPGVTVERGPIFVVDGPIVTSAGATAGIDLALALVEADHGPKLARQVAQYMVVFMQRPGGQEQFSARLRSEPDDRSAIRPLLDAVATDPAGDHRLSTMSARIGFSERHLTRVFAKELGTTPARYVEQVRLEAARTLLETSNAGLTEIARRSGLSSTETLRRTFTREIGVTPHAYRQRFRTTGVDDAAT